MTETGFYLFPKVYGLGCLFKDGVENKFYENVRQEKGTNQVKCEEFDISNSSHLTCRHQDINVYGEVLFIINVEEVIIPLGGLQYWDGWY